MLSILKTYQKQITLFVKLSIVFWALYFIKDRFIASFHHQSVFSTTSFLSFVKSNLSLVLLIIVLSLINWLLEFYKWKVLVSKIKNVTLFESINQCLGSLTASIITPNRVGEYGAKALFYLPKDRKQIVALNFIGNMAQLLITIFFGSIGLYYIISNYSIDFSTLNFNKIILLIVVVFLILIGIYFGLNRLNYWKKIHAFLKQLHKSMYQKVIVLSFLRYVVFSHQFYFLMVLFDVQIDYKIALFFIFGMYLLASLLPSLALLDWVIKGSVALFLFSLVTNNTASIFFITSVMWILNFGIPTLLGTYFVLKFKPIKK